MLPAYKDEAVSWSFKIYKTGDPTKFCKFTWIDTILRNVPASSYRSGCHDEDATKAQIDSTATYEDFKGFDTIEVN